MTLPIINSLIFASLYASLNYSNKFVKHKLPKEATSYSKRQHKPSHPFGSFGTCKASMYMVLS